MPRNFIRRVEIIFPIEDADIKKRVVNEILKITFSDNVKARVLQSDGSYIRAPRAAKSKPIRCQEIFIELADIEDLALASLDTTSATVLADLIRPRDYLEATQSLGVSPETHHKQLQEKKIAEDEDKE